MKVSRPSSPSSFKKKKSLLLFHSPVRDSRAFSVGWPSLQAFSFSPAVVIVSCLLLFQPVFAMGPLVIPRGGGGGGDGGSHNNHNKKNVILVLDVDNTLYDESLLSSLSSSSSSSASGGYYYYPPGIEEQIVKNIHTFCASSDHVSSNLPKEKADTLHHTYGTTIEGLRQTVWKKLTENEMSQKMKHCYDEIWNDNNMDYSTLLLLHQPTKSSLSHLTTGYSHGDDPSSQMEQLRSLLSSSSQSSSPPSSSAMYLASNSPSWHVQNVIQAMGLCHIKWNGIVTPDSPRSSSSGTSTSAMTVYPTKHSPNIFYQDILQQRHVNNNKKVETDIVLIDDSKTNIDVFQKQQQSSASATKMKGIRIERPETSIQTALLKAWGVINNEEDSSSSYQFSQIEYLKSKNIVDSASLNREIWHQVAKELQKDLQQWHLEIVDVGAGLLSMLRLILMGEDQQQDMPSLLDQLSPSPESVTYYAYEPNPELQSECIRILEKEMGFVRTEIDDEQYQEYIFVSDNKIKKGCKVTVHLRLYDYNNDPPSGHVQPNPQLIVGCCFADLFDPYQLVSSLLHRFLSSKSSSSSSSSKSCLCYFPITFRGITQFIPPQPFEINNNNNNNNCGHIPSDTVAFALYSKTLEHVHKHNLDPQKLIQAMEAFGATLVAKGDADWDISPHSHQYLWETLLYFFERVAGPALLHKGWDAAGWFQRARRIKRKADDTTTSPPPNILVSNVDLLFRMPRLGQAQAVTEMTEEKTVVDDSDDALRQQDDAGAAIMEEIEFTAPYEVSTTRKNLNNISLGPNQVQIKSEYSLISSGTELKIFKGMFDDDAALDVNIKGMDEERMAYPLAYGYSLVGRVVRCGSEVEDADRLLGKLVFTFSAHATHVITDRDAIQVVPDGIEARDAIFMPSVETALSIVHDAHVRLGETVAVFGQGLIGLLVTAILSNTVQQKMDLEPPCSSCGGEYSLGSKLGTVTTIDAIPSRLAASAAMGSSQALLPSQVQASGPFDVAIEVSGNAGALQAAIDNTSNHGRLVLASWYGNADVALKLGIEFHRSHKTIVTSQVSEIKAELSGLWTKQRRFGLTWELVKQLRPSRLITRQTGLRNAQKAYEALDKGTEIAIAFCYTELE